MIILKFTKNLLLYNKISIHLQYCNLSSYSEIYKKSLILLSQELAIIVYNFKLYIFFIFYPLQFYKIEITLTLILIGMYNMNN